MMLLVKNGSYNLANDEGILIALLQAANWLMCIA